MTAHYFSASPEGPEHRRRLDVEVWGRRFALTGANGVVAAGGLDRGAEVMVCESRPPTGEACVLLVAHNPGLQALAIEVALDDPRLAAGFPPGTAAVLDRGEADAWTVALFHTPGAAA